MEGQPDGHRPLPARGGRRLRGRHHTGRRRGRGARRGSRGRGGGALARGGTAGRPSWPTPAGRPTESARMLVTVRLPWAGGPSARRSAGDGPTRIQQRHAVQNAAGQDARALEAAGADHSGPAPPAVRQAGHGCGEAPVPEGHLQRLQRRQRAGGRAKRGLPRKYAAAYRPWGTAMVTVWPWSMHRASRPGGGGKANATGLPAGRSLPVGAPLGVRPYRYSNVARPGRSTGWRRGTPAAAGCPRRRRRWR